MSRGNGCPECERSYGPQSKGMKCEHGVRSEVQPSYGKRTKRSDDATIAKALEILAERMKHKNERTKMLDPTAVRRFLTLKLAEERIEKFVAFWLDSQHRVISFEVLSTGTIDGASVYPREVVRAAIAAEAAAVIFAHNHPSGVPEPSAADRTLTERLKAALAQVDVRALDHFVVGGTSAVSFAERGWM